MQRIQAADGVIQPLGRTVTFLGVNEHNAPLVWAVISMVWVTFYVAVYAYHGDHLGVY
jgi:hypothetical protein